MKLSSVAVGLALLLAGCSHATTHPLPVPAPQSAPTPTPTPSPAPQGAPSPQGAPTPAPPQAGTAAHGGVTVKHVRKNGVHRIVFRGDLARNRHRHVAGCHHHHHG